LGISMFRRFASEISRDIPLAGPVISEPLEVIRSRCEERSVEREGKGQDVLLHRAWAELMG